MATDLVEAPLTRADYAEALRNLHHHATRQIPKVGTVDFPTPWDRAHRRIDDALTEWEAAP